MIVTLSVILAWPDEVAAWCDGQTVPTLIEADADDGRVGVLDSFDESITALLWVFGEGPLKGQPATRDSIIEVYDGGELLLIAPSVDLKASNLTVTWNPIRCWLLPSGNGGRIVTGPQLRWENIHPLRCVYLGRFCDPDGADARAAADANRSPPELVIAHNIRIACDRRQTKRWRLSDQEIDLLRVGQTLKIRDALGEFHVGYSRLSPEEAE